MSKHAIKRLYVPICPLMTTFVNLKELQMTLIKSKLQTALIDIIRWFSRQVTVTWQLMKRATLMNRRGPFQSFMHNLSTCYLTCSIITSSPQQICQPCVLQFGSHGSWHFLRTLSCRPDRWCGSLSILRNKEKFCQRPWHQHSAFSWKQENRAILNANQTFLVLHKQTTNPCHISPKQTSNYKIWGTTSVHWPNWVPNCVWNTYGDKTLKSIDATMTCLC